MALTSSTTADQQPSADAAEGRGPAGLAAGGDEKGASPSAADAYADGAPALLQADSSMSTGLPGNAAIPVLERSDDTDSVFADSAAADLSDRSSMTSVNSSLCENEQEHGRTYHMYKTGKYVLPNDEQEQDRLDLQHTIFLLLFEDKLHLAPLDNSNLHNVLDFATGTGIWAIEFAEHYPSANVVGTDLTPIQPQYVPPNCRFEIDDAEDEWVYSHPFSYIHGRAILSCFADPALLIRKAFANLTPGGYLELQDLAPLEYEAGVPEDQPIRTWMELTKEGAIKGGRPWDNAIRYAGWMRDAGFVNVEERVFKLPSNPYDGLSRRQKLIGTYNRQNLLDGLEGLSMRNFTRNLGWDPAEVRVLVAKVREDLKNGVKAYSHV
ncbi:MAG: hypothetical protein M1821_002695 [Bathelium mastoideum]|nr:MAG: hypothetical protein M1821_002695 [Bathelium mastoideum]